MNIPELEQYEPTQKGDALVVFDIPNELYHSDVGKSSSFFRKFGESQIHALEVEHLWISVYKSQQRNETRVFRQRLSRNQ